jgi:hypothetical protein
MPQSMYPNVIMRITGKHTNMKGTESITVDIYNMNETKIENSLRIDL